MALVREIVIFLCIASHPLFFQPQHSQRHAYADSKNEIKINGEHKRQRKAKKEKYLFICLCFPFFHFAFAENVACCFMFVIRQIVCGLSSCEKRVFRSMCAAAENELRIQTIMGKIRECVSQRFICIYSYRYSHTPSTDINVGLQCGCGCQNGSIISCGC